MSAWASIVTKCEGLPRPEWRNLMDQTWARRIVLAYALAADPDFTGADVGLSAGTFTGTNGRGYQWAALKSDHVELASIALELVRSGLVEPDQAPATAIADFLATVETFDKNSAGDFDCREHFATLERKWAAVCVTIDAIRGNLIWRHGLPANMPAPGRELFEALSHAIWKSALTRFAPDDSPWLEAVVRSAKPPPVARIIVEADRVRKLNAVARMLGAAGDNGDAKAKTPPAGADESTGPALTVNQSRVLQTMARFDASRLLSAKMIAEEMDPSVRLSEETVRQCVGKLIESGLAERPEGDRSGARLNSVGRKLAGKIAD